MRYWPVCRRHLQQCLTLGVPAHEGLVTNVDADDEMLTAAVPCRRAELLTPLAAKMVEEPFKLLIMDRCEASGGSKPNAHHTQIWGQDPADCGSCNDMVSIRPRRPHVLLHRMQNVRLCYLRSITANLRVDFCGRGELADRQQKLGQLMSALKKIAEQFNVAVVITNQVS